MSSVFIDCRDEYGQFEFCSDKYLKATHAIDLKFDNRIVWPLTSQVFETAGEYIVMGQMFGATKDNIDIGIEGCVLKISFELHIPFHLPVDFPCMRSNHYTKLFSSSHYIPSHVDKEDVQCVFEGQVLYVRFAKIVGKVPEIKRLYISG